MAIQDSFNITQALNNQSYAYKCWYNYNYENNTMGISSSDMGQIVDQYSGVMENWKATATKDENKYEIADDDFNTAVNNGFSDAANQTGYEGNGKTGMVMRGIGDTILGGAGVVLNNIGGTVVGGLASKTLVNKIGEGAAIQKAGSGAWIITAPLALAVGTLYQAKKPNKDQYNAAVELRDNLLPEAQAQSVEAQETMEEADSELIELSEEAETVNEDANEDIEENKSEFDLYKASYDALIEKVQSGEPLTDEEKELLKQLVPIMQQIGEDLTSLGDETIEYIQDLYADMEDYQSYFDDAAEMIATVQGITDYAESFDETARTMMYVEAVAQGINAASGTQAAMRAGRFAASGGIFTAWAWAFVGMGAAGAAMSGLGTMEQMKWANETGAEIDLREATQELNAASSDVYDERVDDYEGYMEGIEDLELEIPEDIEPPEETPVVPEGGDDPAASAAFGIVQPTTNGGAAGTGGTTGGNGSNGDDKDDDKKPRQTV